MANKKQLTPASPWVELATTDADWDGASAADLRLMLVQTLWIRVFEEYVLQLAADGLVHGPAHSSIGQEGGAVGSILDLTSDDFVNGSHRGHHQFLAKAFGHVLLGKSEGLPELDENVRRVLRRTL